MQLNHSTDYALRSLIVLHGNDQGVSSKDISKAVGIEREFTLKILRQLKMGNFVEASRGKAGGYKLARPLNEITMLEFLRHMEDSIFINRSFEEKHPSEDEGKTENRPEYDFYRAFQAKLEEMFDGITIMDLVDHTYKL